MTKQDMSILPPHKQEMFKELEQLFNSAGWTYLANEWKTQAEGLAEQVFFGAGSYEDLQHARIRWALLQELISLPSDTEQAKQQAIEEALYERE